MKAKLKNILTDEIIDVYSTQSIHTEAEIYDILNINLD